MPCATPPVFPSAASHRRASRSRCRPTPIATYFSPRWSGPPPARPATSSPSRRRSLCASQAEAWSISSPHPTLPQRGRGTDPQLPQMRRETRSSGIDPPDRGRLRDLVDGEHVGGGPHHHLFLQAHLQDVVERPQHDALQPLVDVVLIPE